MREGRCEAPVSVDMPEDEAINVVVESPSASTEAAGAGEGAGEGLVENIFLKMRRNRWESRGMEGKGGTASELVDN